MEVRTMSEKRIQKTAFGVFVLIVGMLVMIAAGLSALMYPNQGNVSKGIFAVACLLIVVAFILSPNLLQEILTSRKSWLWVNDIIMVISIIGIGILLTYIGGRHNIKYDLTRDRLFSLSDSTIQILKDLQKEVKVTSFFPTGSIEGKMVEDLLEEYKRRTGKLRHEMVDPFKDHLKTKAMGIRAAGTVIVQCENNRKDLSEDDLFIKPSPFMRNPQMERPKFQGEQAITSAILNVTQGGRKKIMFVTGHDEPSISTYNPQGFAGVQQFLVKENYDVTEGSLMEAIPSGTTVLAIMAPKKSFHPSEIENLRKFVFDQKGRLMVGLDTDTKIPELDKFLSENFGVIANYEIIINPRAINNNLTIVIPQYEYHSIVKAQMEKKSGALFQLCRGLVTETKPQWKTQVFLKAGDQTYAKRKMEEVLAGNLDFTNGIDARGPFNLAVALEGQENASGSRAVIFGDSDFASNLLLQVQGNADLMVNTVNWLAGQEQLISIRPKTLEFGQINLDKLDKEAINRIFILCVIVSPLIIVLVGGAVWFARRRV